MRRWLLVVLPALIPGSVYAQRMFSGPHFSGRGVPFHSPHFSRGAGAYYLPLFDSFYGDYAAPAESPAAQPSVIVVQPQAAPPAAVTSPPAQPLMIELRGDRYVQISGDGNSSAEMLDDGQLNSNVQPLGKTSPSVHNIVLIFRDGHREEVSNYTVADGFLYASADYYTAGSWIRKVPISELNVAETVAANQSQGAAFRLPSAANEVVVGP